MKSKGGTILRDLQKKLSKTEGECARCKRKYYLTVDHIIPSNFLYSLNLIDEIQNWEENFEIICGACNKMKGGNIDINHPKTFKLLEEAIKRSKAQL